MKKKIIKFLNEKIKNKKVEEINIREYLKIEDYSLYVKIIKELEEEKVINKIKMSGSNGMKPALYKRYTITRTKEKEESYETEIKSLSLEFSIEFYLKNQKKYKENREWINQLDNFLKNKSEELNQKISINERSFEIFRKEKFLKANYDKIFLVNERLERSLNFYNTFEPFFTFSLEKNLKNVEGLICENKDTWYTFKRYLENNQKSQSFKYNFLIYGEGKKIARKSNTLTEFTKLTFEDKEISYEYFGDIDYEGIRIYNSLKESNPDLNIKLNTKLYLKALKMSIGMDLPKYKENQKKVEEGIFFDEFNSNEKELILKILKSGKYIPQEIISYKALLKMEVKNV